MMMAQSISRNTYEESPERLQEVVKNRLNSNDKMPLKGSRRKLVREHEVNLKLLSEGNVPVRSFVLPLPYPPARITIEDASSRKVQLRDLSFESRDPNTIILLRTITSSYIYSSTISIAEDEDGNATRITVCNLEDTVVDPMIPKGAVLAIKQPCWSLLVDGGYHIRVDHPSDVVILKGNDTRMPQSWMNSSEVDTTKDADAWKKEGDMRFLKKRFRQALECYNRGLDVLGPEPDPALAIDLYRKKCGVNIVLLRLDDAAQDLSLAISAHASSAPFLSESLLTDQATIVDWLHSHTTDDPLQIATQIPRPLKELAARIKFDLGVYQSEATYNLPLISSYVGPLTLHVDAANYVSATEVRQTACHGRGLFAKRSFKPGELICAEKAFVLPGYFIQDRSSDCLLYSLGDGTASPRPGALLFKELVQKLKWNKSLRNEYFDLDDGGYWKTFGYEVAKGEDVPVDVFRVEKIRQLNCFSVPTRSLDLLSAPPNSNPELRNGFWNHASYVNHSCLPNTVRTFIGDVHFLRATRDIAVDEELTHQYVSPEIDISDRQEKFRGTWGFECDCRLCIVDGEVEEEKKKERLRVFEDLKAIVMKLGERGTTVTSIKKIARGLKELEALYTPNLPEDKDVYEELPRLALVHPTLFLTEAWRGMGNTDKMVEFARKLLRNFGIFTKIEGEKFEIRGNTGLINVEAVRALKYLAEGYVAKGEAQLAKQCIDVAKLWFVIITGSEVGIEEFLSS